MKVALAVPGKGLCGINDYTLALRGAFSGKMDVIKEASFKAVGYDLLHVQYEATLFRKGRSTLYPKLMQKNRNLPKVVTVHEVWEENPFIAPRPQGFSPFAFLKKWRYDFRHALEYREERLARLSFMADTVIVHTRFAKRILINKGCAPDRIEVLPHPVFPHKPDPRPLPGLEVFATRERIALLFGFLSPVTDYDTVLSALAELKGQYKLIIAGGIRRPEDLEIDHAIEKKVKALGLADHVRRLAYVDPKDLDALFTTAHVFLHAPRFKTASGALAHALGAGLPVIASDLPHVSEMNAERNCIRTFTPGNPETLMLRLKELYDRDERSQARERIRRYADEHTIEKFAESHASLYRRLLEHRT